jgi:hypothetical protein
MVLVHLDSCNTPHVTQVLRLQAVNPFNLCTSHADFSKNNPLAKRMILDIYSPI